MDYESMSKDELLLELQRLKDENDKLQQADDEKKTEEALRRQTELHQVQKMQAIGTLAAGIAHEINTPIQFIGDNARFISDCIEDLFQLIRLCKDCVAITDDALREACVRKIRELEKRIDLPFLETEIPAALSQSQEGIERVTEIVNAMKDYSHRGSERKQKENINNAIQSAATISRNRWKYVAEMVIERDPALPLVECCIGDIKQVILNLIINAADSMVDRIEKGKRENDVITIRTRQKKGYVVISVSDTGVGIPKDIQPHIFDPFFTSKEVGKGTGQGLAMAHLTVVKNHGGKLTFETEEGKGTTFYVWLPI